MQRELTLALDLTHPLSTTSSSNISCKISYLDVILDDGTHKSYQLFTGDNIITRDGEGEGHRIALNKRTVSKPHATIQGLLDGSFFIGDNNSTNRTSMTVTGGTYTDLLPGRYYQLVHGCSLKFGSVYAKFRVVDQTESSEFAPTIKAPSVHPVINTVDAEATMAFENIADDNTQPNKDDDEATEIDEDEEVPKLPVEDTKPSSEEKVTEEKSNLPTPPVSPTLELETTPSKEVTAPSTPTPLLAPQTPPTVKEDDEDEKDLPPVSKRTSKLKHVEEEEELPIVTKRSSRLKQVNSESSPSSPSTESPVKAPEATPAAKNDETDDDTENVGDATVAETSTASTETTPVKSTPTLEVTEPTTTTTPVKPSPQPQSDEDTDMTPLSAKPSARQQKLIKKRSAQSTTATPETTSSTVKKESDEEEDTTTASNKAKRAARVSSTQASTPPAASQGGSSPKKRRKLQPKSEDSDEDGAPVQWFYQHDLRFKSNTQGDHVWSKYPAADNVRIEKEYKSGKPTMTLNSTYDISFSEMIQYRSDDKYRQRPIKRVPPPS